MMYSQKMVLNQQIVTILALFWVMRLFYLSRIAKNDPNGVVTCTLFMGRRE